ncbi:MAG: hypothetical protein ETSY2_47990 [Candidatus Entotheonella gemina]|uniref:Uncharacterized protein n=1 Tax=Candidatus Entotheonella gemina TaxID=1429439 RepID=W4LCS2_9BACT|nr:hypothetical protein [Candidatus Entotheonella palauensis]ETW95520.1 MAG: hypothetical protein ETSY2_47990 [Candidatus Entotheonella gemina]
MNMPYLKEVDSQFDEVIPITRHKDTIVSRSIVQLGVVIESVPLNLVHTNDIET